MSAVSAGIGAAASGVGFDDPLVFGRSVAADLELLRCLREATGHTPGLSWRLAGRPRVPIRTHVHLTPPTDGVDPAAREYAARWRAQYHYGSFYYRQGPDFITVRDVRPGGDASRLVIRSGAADFRSMVDAHAVDDLTVAQREMVPTAVDAGLVLVADGALVVLPYRLRRWPVPASAI
jgi:hypothetical protein